MKLLRLSVRITHGDYKAIQQSLEVKSETAKSYLMAEGSRISKEELLKPLSSFHDTSAHFSRHLFCLEGDLQQGITALREATQKAIDEYKLTVARGRTETNDRNPQ